MQSHPIAPHLLLHRVDDLLEMLGQDVALGRQGTHAAVLFSEVCIDAATMSSEHARVI